MTSCVPETHPPIGVWKSESPGIILYVKPDYQPIPGHGFRYPVTYILEGEETKAFVKFGNGPRFSVFDMSAIESGVLNIGRWLLVGSYQIRNNELHFTLFDGAREKTGYDVIILHRLEDYDPINPEDWWSPSD